MQNNLSGGCKMSTAEATAHKVAEYITQEVGHILPPCVRFDDPESIAALTAIIRAGTPSVLCESHHYLLRQLYNTERGLPDRNYAKDHSFEEWVEHSGYKTNVSACAGCGSYYKHKHSTAVERQYNCSRECEQQVVELGER
jgi:hypothetical protein